MFKKDTKSALSPEKRQLVELCQKTNFGSLKSFKVRAGEPVLDPPPTIIRTCKFGGDNGPHPALAHRDFLLKDEVKNLVEIFEHEQTLDIEELVVANGLPVRMTIRETVKVKFPRQ